MPELINFSRKAITLSIRERLKLGQLPNWVHWTGLGGTLLVLIGSVLIFLILKKSTPLGGVGAG
ncbi:MAG: hypothetical protein MUE75_13675 [Algoriphagus sp.]|jgi:hypothetical protein|nr:hypothetical protein [Algoriphagus sp.]